MKEMLQVSIGEENIMSEKRDALIVRQVRSLETSGPFIESISYGYSKFSIRDPKNLFNEHLT